MQATPLQPMNDAQRALLLERLARVTGLDQGQRLKDALREDWAALVAELGRAPLMMEVELRSRFSVRQFRQSFGDWFGVLEQCGGMTDTDRRLQAQCGAFLRELETTAMTKSYKMVTLQAMFRDGEFQRAVNASALCQHFRAHFAKEQHRHDIDGTAIAEEVLAVMYKTDDDVDT